jgi:hypothetical protein
MSSYDDTACLPSPASSSGVVDSGGGTSRTSPAAFSPEDVRAVKSATANLNGSCQHDPFMSSGGQGGGRLSARASAFKPSFEMRASAPDPYIAIESSQKMMGSKSSGQVVEESAGSPSPNAPPMLHDVNPATFGAFTTDTNTSRVLKVTGKDIVATFLPFVEASKRVSKFILHIYFLHITSY